MGAARAQIEIRTERLLLRPVTMDDLDDVLAMHAAPEVARFMRAVTRELAIQRLQADQRQWRERGHGLLAVSDAASGRFLGRVGLKYWPQFAETEVGWVFRPKVWGRGFATEAARACAQWGFDTLDVPYLMAMVRPLNERSIRVAERLGMAPQRQDELLDLPVVVYAVNRERWAAARPTSRTGRASSS
jgi:RimJ/RimL family protein N-acetyltransferase